MKLNYPPLIAIACIIVQVLLYFIVPLELNLSLFLGLILMILSLGIITIAFKELHNNQTTYIPDGDPERLVTTGAFSISRNPIYLGMAGVLLSLAFLLQSLSALLIPILFITIIQSTWIPHEEKKLAETFGDDWKNYSTKTKKWLW
tara:strand:+ start:6108 stop:6545 length:438 start_codon:yes stop_codon:yes gene_type:complete